MKQTSPRLSVPAPGRSVSSIVERVGRPIRNAVCFLRDGSNHRKVSIDQIARPFPFHSDFGATIEPANERASWMLVNTYILWRNVLNFPSPSSFDRALKWFLADDDELAETLLSGFSLKSRELAAAALNSLTINDDLFDLLPYILDLHGTASRLSVMRDPTTKETRTAKKKDGIFYTPTDVVDFMTSSLAAASKDLCGFWIDPACGTGVYLRSVIELFEKKEIQENTSLNSLQFCLVHLYGVDISTLATESCAFVLLNACASNLENDHSSPYRYWLSVRLNLAAGDATELCEPVRGCFGTPQLSGTEIWFISMYHMEVGRD